MVHLLKQIREYYDNTKYFTENSKKLGIIIWVSLS